MGDGDRFVCVFPEDIRDYKSLPALLAGGGLQAVGRFSRLLGLDIGLIVLIVKSIHLAPHTPPPQLWSDV